METIRNHAAPKRNAIETIVASPKFKRLLLCFCLRPQAIFSDSRRYAHTSTVERQPEELGEWFCHMVCPALFGGFT